MNHETKVNVYYGTRIVGTSPPSNLALGNTQVLRRDCAPVDIVAIMRTQLIARHVSETPPMAATFAPSLGKADILGEEEEQMLRQELIDTYAESEELKQKQLALLRTSKSVTTDEPCQNGNWLGLR